MADLKCYMEGRGAEGSKAAGLDACKLKQCKGPSGSSAEALHQQGPAHPASARLVARVLSPSNTPDAGLGSSLQRRIISKLPSTWIGETEAGREKMIYDMSADHFQSQGKRGQLTGGRIRPDFQPVLIWYLSRSLWRVLSLLFKHPFSFAQWRVNLFQ